MNTKEKTQIVYRERTNVWLAIRDGVIIGVAADYRTAVVLWGG